MIEELIIKNRSCRRFYQSKPVHKDTLIDLVNLARLSASAANLQPLKYILSNDPDRNAEIFSCLAWAAYLKDWAGPAEGERPAAYMILLGDTGITSNFHCDHGIASQSILLGAREKGLAGCILAAVNREKLRTLLAIPDQLEILLVLAIGYPREDIVIDPVGKDGSIRYWRDANGVHHVPKRDLQEIIVTSYFS
ncbi:nitroreductase family protein [Desulfatirhabdium butyrativorans]|uniref:nitroreductase family protein n=1 Tax=Desulfatirhabdium butyrativorans TaxID=340467 RepID=UPI0004171328|nr:nitroreductase family protein [Desulfatirhabdium butyrativorans]